MTVYNGAKYIHKSIESIVNQTFKDFELVVVNDGSTDLTLQILQEISDKRIKVINSKHIGRSAALNLCISQTVSPIIALQDADDISVPERLQKQYDVLLKSSQNTVISCSYAVFEKNRIRYIVKPPLKSDTIKKNLSLTCHFPNAAIMMYKDFFDRIGQYKDIQYGLEDYELFLRMKNKVHFEIIPEVLLFYHYSICSLSNNNYLNRKRLQYSLQSSYYENAITEFGFEDVLEENEFRGWREYFYGDRKKARILWNKMKLEVFNHPRVIIAWFISFLPEDLFIRFKESRLRFRIQYYLCYFNNESRQVRAVFSKVNKKADE